MTPIYLSSWAWASWILIGIVAGLMAFFFFSVRLIMFFDILFGLIGTIAGGCGSSFSIGDHTPQTFATAALVALFIARAALWIYNPILTRLIGRK